MANARVSRGRATQNLIAEWFQQRGWPQAKSRAASLPGVDVYDMDGLSPEVKATAKETATGALKQAVKNAGDGLPFVIYRPPGYGPEKIGKWPVFLELESFTALLRKAGYGEPD